MNTVTLSREDWITVVSALKVVAELLADDVSAMEPSALKSLGVNHIASYNEVEHKLVQALKEDA